MEYRKENHIEKSEVIEVAKTKENSEVNHVTEIKRENSPLSSKFIDSEHNHIQFENVMIKMEREDKFFEENERFDNPLVNRGEISVDSQNDTQLTTCAIKKENINQDFQEQLFVKFGNIMETFDCKHDNMEIKVEKNYDYSSHSEKCDNVSSTNIDEIKIDTMDNDVKSINSNSIKDDDETDKEANCSHKTLESNQKNTSLSRNPKQPKKCDEDNQNVTIVKKHECLVCKKKFRHPSLLIRHMLIHTGEKPHQCEVCQMKFNQLSTLRTHRIIHTGEKQHKCDICLKTFFKLFTLKEHMRTHTGEKSYECVVCKKKFAQLSTLSMHNKIHSGEKLHKCEVCQKRFVTLFNLTEHTRIHTGETPYECSVCQKKFTQFGTLSKHHKSHTGVKPYKCDVCLKKFVQVCHLKEHMLIHTDEKLHECGVCHKKFIRLSNLRKHMLIHTE